VQPATSQSTPATFPLATATPLPLLTQHRQQVILVHTTLLPQQRTIFQTHNATRFTSCETCSGAATIRPRPLQVEIKMYTYFPDSVRQLILFIYFNCPLVIVFSSAVRHLWHSKKLKYIFQLFRNYFKSKNVEVKIQVYQYVWQISLHIKLICQVAPPTGRSGLAVACLTAVCEVLRLNHAVGSCVYRKNHCDLQHLSCSA